VGSGSPPPRDGETLISLLFTKRTVFLSVIQLDEALPMEPTIRIITRGANGELRTKDYEKHESVLKMHTQIGVDDCSTDLKLRGMPVFRGLIGPMPESTDIVRYESPEVFETLTKEWGTTTPVRRRRRRATS